MLVRRCSVYFFFFKQKTAYEMRISDWSSDVCSSDLSLLDKLLSALPKESDVDSKPLAQELAGRPLSDVAFVVREGARLAARSGKERLDQASLLAALRTTPARSEERRVGKECVSPCRSRWSPYN